MISSPKPPNPYAQASAQQSADLFGGAASSIINNANEVNPWGSVNYSNAGYETLYDAQGRKQYVPRYNRTVQLSPDQMKLLGLQTQTQFNLGQTGVEQSSKLREHLGKGVDTSNLQAWATPGAPGRLATGYADVGPVQRQVGTFGAAGPIQRNIAAAGDVRQDAGATNRSAIEQAMLGRYNENVAKSRAAEDAALAARGMAPGGQGYGTVQAERGRQDVDAWQQAYLASGAESRAAQEAYNAAQGQRFGQNAAAGTFANQAQQQAYAQALGRGQFDIARGQFANAAQEQAYQQAAARAAFGNTAGVQQYQMGADYASQLNALRQGMLGETLALRNQPINEIVALLGGSQVTVPEFAPFSRQGINAAPVGSYIGQNYANAANAAANANAGLFSGLGSAVSGLFGLV